MRVTVDQFSLQLLMESTYTLREIESRRAVRAFGADHSPEAGGLTLRQRLAQLLASTT